LRKPFSLFEKGASLSIDRCKQNPNLKDNVKYQDTKSMRLHIMNSINKLEPRRYLPLLKNLVILKTHLLVLTIISSKLGRLFLSQNKIDLGYFAIILTPTQPLNGMDNAFPSISSLFLKIIISSTAHACSLIS